VIGKADRSFWKSFEKLPAPVASPRLPSLAATLAALPSISEIPFSPGSCVPAFLIQKCSVAFVYFVVKKIVSARPLKPARETRALPNPCHPWFLDSTHVRGVSPRGFAAFNGLTF
jgi:hypothetical protein